MTQNVLSRSPRNRWEVGPTISYWLEVYIYLLTISIYAVAKYDTSIPLAPSQSKAGRHQ